ncbi:MAG: SIMPL domain-containing protein [Bacteroidota bacterium]
MKTTYLQTILTSCVLVLMIFMFGKSLLGQESSHTQKKQITVTGSAEMNIDPDQLELSITLHTNRTELDKREDDLVVILQKHNIPKEQLIFNHSDSWWDWWYYRNHNEINKTFKIKLNSKTNLLDLVKDLNKTWVHSVSITNTTHKDILTYRKEVKKEAVKAAKDKASYLLDAIDEKIGPVISIEEMTNDNQNYGGWYWQNSLSNSISNSNISMNAGDSNSSDKIDNLSQIKLRYEVKAVFEIK